VPRTRLLDTSTFRLTVVYFGLFSLSALAILGFVQELSRRFIERETRDAIATDAFSLQRQHEQHGLAGLVRAINARAALEADRSAVYLLLDRTRLRVVAGNLPGEPPYEAAEGDAFVRFEVAVPGRGGRERLHPALGMRILIGDRYLLLVGRDIQDKVVTLRMIRLASAIGAAIMLVLGLVGGYVMSRWMLHRLDVINRTTARIMAGDLSRRIEVSGTDDEFDELGRNVNLMLDRIDRLLAGMRQVTDDVAHDLRTPLNRLRSRIEVALMREDLDAASAREVMEATIRDADGLIETFNALLSIARAEAGGGQRAEWERIDLARIVDEVFELYEPLAEERGITLAAETEPGAVATGSPQLVAQAIANLADNAIKYTPPGGRVWLRAAARPLPRVEVADDGPGIPPADRERAKQRFVRLDATRSTPGSGLGLSLADAVARLHDARLELLDNEPAGLKVRLTFPAPAAPATERPARAERAPAYVGRPATADRAAD
jgi:signal transduction histidine kinase